ncbi:MAG: hypothetical protein KC503_41220, partial [Myxococcales bacterium]|nr:hypothetical protein [Myxococcales bacterium]
VEVLLRHDLRLPVGLDADRARRSAEQRRVPLTLRLRVNAGSPLLEIDVALENRADDHRLALALPLPFAARHYLAGSPFALTRRPFAAPPARPRWVQPPGEAQPFQHAVLVEAPRAGHGVALFAPGLREIASDPALAPRSGVALRLTLLRSVRWLSRADLSTRPAGDAGPPWRVEGARQQGPLALRLALLAYPRGARGEALRAGRLHADPPRLLAPTEPAPTDAPPRPVTSPRAALDAITRADGGAAARGLLCLEPADVQLTALVPAGAGQLDARLLNCSPRRRHAQLRGPFERRALAVNLRGERTSELDRLDVPLDPWQLRTVRLSLLQ